VALVYGCYGTSSAVDMCHSNAKKNNAYGSEWLQAYTNTVVPSYLDMLPHTLTAKLAADSASSSLL
jgi:hypothetical protein